MSQLPNFLYIGAAKAGSTWLERSLREHPEVYVPPAKDLFFFDRQYHRGLSWYAAHFNPCHGETAVGELSHDYFQSRETMERILGDLPEVRLIACLRDPVTRLFSRYIYHRSVENLPEMSLEEYASRPDIAAESAYLRNLGHVYSLFPRDRILVVFYEDLSTDSAAFIASVYEFLGVRPDFRPSTIDTVILGAQRARFRALTYPALAASRIMRNAGLANVVGWIKRRPSVERLLFTTYAQPPQLSSEEASALYSLYSPDYAALEQLIGRAVPDQWYRHGHRSSTSPAT